MWFQRAKNGKLESNPYETSSAAAALQNDFKKRYKRAAKGLAAAVAKNGCFALQGKPFDSDKQRCSRIPESRSALQSGCKVASNFKTKNVVPGNVLPLVSTKKRNADFNNTITTKHGREVDKALGGVKTTRKSKCN